MDNVSPAMANHVNHSGWSTNVTPMPNFSSHTGSSHFPAHASNQGPLSGAGQANLVPGILGEGRPSLLPGVLPASRANHFVHPHAGILTGFSLQLPKVPAVSAGLATRTIELDLTSKASEIVLGSKLFGKQTSVEIELNGVKATFRPGSLVTAGEFVAIHQILSGGKQGIILSAQGAATGGSFSLNAESKSRIDNLVIPAGVTAVDYASRTGLKISGDLTNYGSIEGIATGKNSIVSISAADITNEAGASISTATGNHNSVDAAGSTGKSVDLIITASGNLSNAGIIKSTGNVNLSSNAGNFINSGMIESTCQNINIGSSSPGANINVTAPGGVFRATSGNINVRDCGYNGNANITLAGGDYFSKNFNLNSGSGAISGQVGTVTGNLNTTAAVEHFAADTSNLVLGNNTIKGDPVFASTGNITISGVNTFTEDVAILAEGDITAGDSAAAIVANGHNVTLIAGAKLLDLGSGTINGGSVDMPSSAVNSSGGTGTANGTGTHYVGADLGNPTGGSIDLTGSKTSTLIDTSSNGLGGDVTLIALSNGTTGGTINLPPSSTINTSSSGYTAGSIYVLADASPSVPTSTINLGNILGTGNNNFYDVATLKVYTQAPLGGRLDFQANGSVAGLSAIPSSTISIKNAGVTINSIVFTGNGSVSGTGETGGYGGSVSIFAGDKISVNGPLLTYGGGGGGGAGGGPGGLISLQSAFADIFVAGDINSSGGGGGAGTTSGYAGGSAGAVVVTSPTNVLINGRVLAASGGDGSINGFGGGGFGGTGGGSKPATGYLPGGSPESDYTSYNGVFVPGPGSLRSQGGSVLITGKTVSITGVLPNYDNFGGDSVVAAGKGGNVTITNQASATFITVPVQSLDLSSSTRNSTAFIPGGSTPFIVGVMPTTSGSLGGIYSTTETQINGDSNSTHVTKGTFSGSFITINLQNGNSFTPNAYLQGNALSAAEYMSAMQIASGSQTLLLSGYPLLKGGVSGGTAIGGTFDVNPSMVPATGFGALGVPANVTANINIPTLNLNGTATVQGTVNFNVDHLIVTSTGDFRVENGIVNFSGTSDLTMASGGILYLGTANFPQVYGSTVNLVAVSSINIGTVTTSGANLNILASTSMDTKDSNAYVYAGGGNVHVQNNITTNGGSVTVVANATAPAYQDPHKQAINGDIEIAGINTGTTNPANNNGSVIELAPGLIYGGLLVTSGNSANGNGGDVTVINCTPKFLPTVIDGVTHPFTQQYMFDMSSLVLTAGGSINVAAITAGTSGYGGLGTGVAGGNGGNGGAVTLLTLGSISAAPILTMGGGGGGGGSSLTGDGGNGGTGGQGGNIKMSAASFGITLYGDINSSGGGGGGGGGAGSGLAGNGGAGGSAGTISLTASSGTITGPYLIYASAGGDGGAGTTSGNGGGGGGSLGAGGGGGASGTGYGGAGGGGYSSIDGVVSGGGGGSAAAGSDASGGNGGGNIGAAKNYGLSPGAGGTGSGGAGLVGTATSGGSGAGGAVGGLNSTGSGGAGGNFGGTPAGSGGDRSVSVTGKDGAISLDAQTIILSSTAAPITVYGSAITVVTSSNNNTVSPMYLTDADYGSANLHDSGLSVGALLLSGSIVATGPDGSLTLNDIKQTSPLGPGNYSVGGITITESGSPYLVTANAKVTPAEYVAIVEVQDTGIQSLTLTGNGLGTGIASGGNFKIDAVNVPTGNFSNLVIPAGVTVDISVPTLTASGLVDIRGTANFNATNATLNAGMTSISGNANFNGAIPSGIGSGTIVSGNGITINGTLTAPGAPMKLTAAAGDIVVGGNLSGLSLALTSSAATGNISILAGGNLQAQPGNFFGTFGQIALVAGTTGQVSVADGGVVQGASIVVSAQSVDNNGNIASGNLSNNYTHISNAAGNLTFSGTGSWTNDTNVQISATGDIDLGNLLSSGQPMPTHSLYINAGGSLSLSSNAIAVAQDSSGNGGNLAISAKNIVLQNGAIPLALSANAGGTGDGGTVQVSLGSDIGIGSAGGNLQISATGGGDSGNGGAAYISTGGNLNADTSQIQLAPQGSTGNGGRLYLSAANGNLTLSGSSLSEENGVGNGNGGIINLAAKNIIYPSSGGAFTLNANGSGTGWGGQISFTTASSAAMSIGGIGGNLSFSATGGSDGTSSAPANGGNVTLSTGGNLTVNPGQINVTPGGASGAGGVISLTAGTASTGGTIIVTGDLKADGIGGGAGGGISLQSNSKTLFSVDSKTTTNGTRGLLSVLGSSPGLDGNISIVNTGAGGVTVSQPLTNALGINIRTGGGAITINQSIGETFSSISLTVQGSGKISAGAKAAITGQTLYASSTSGAITFPNLAAQNITALTGPKAAVTLTAPDTQTAFTVIHDASGSTVTVKSAAWILVPGAITANTVTLQTTAKDAGYIIVEGAVNALSGNVTLTTQGVINVDMSGSINASKNITMSATGSLSDIVVGNTARVEAVGALVGNVPSSSKFNAVNIQSGTTLRGQTIALSAAKSDVIVNGTLQANKTINVSALTGIISRGSLSGDTGVTLTTKSTQGLANGGIEVDNITTGFSGGAGGPINVTAAGGNLIVDPSATISANSEKGGRASIVLLEKSKYIGGIVINSGARITTSGKFGGSIAIAIGTTATTKGNNLPAIAGVTFSPGNPQKVIYLGANGVNFAGGTTNVNVVGKGVKITMNTDSLPASKITIHGGSGGGSTLIQADPPPLSASLTAPHLSVLSSPPEPQLVVTEPTLTVGGAHINITHGAESVWNFANPQQSLFGALTQSAIPGLTSSSQTLYGQATVNNDAEPAPFETVYKGSARKDMGAMEAHVIYGEDLSETLPLKEGNAVLVASKDMSVATDFGTVDLKAGAVALILAFPDATSVFNLDDRHKESIVVSVNSHKLSLAPGQHVTVTREDVESFELINPAEAIAHKGLRQTHLAEKIQVFNSEFSILSAIASVDALKEFIADARSGHLCVARRMLKTAAILSHLSNNMISYELYPHPKMISFERKNETSLSDVEAATDR